MNIQLEKELIVEELQLRNEEWLIIAIKKLLDLDTNSDRFTDEHAAVIKQRIAEYEAHPGDIVTIEDLTRELKAEDRL
jgi:hypothetical protein